MLETLDHTIRIGSTPTFLYFDLCHRLSLLKFPFGRMNVVPLAKMVEGLHSPAFPLGKHRCVPPTFTLIVFTVSPLFAIISAVNFITKVLALIAVLVQATVLSILCCHEGR